MQKEKVEERRAKGLYWDRAWKLVEGCTKVSPGCDNCWSEAETSMRSNHPNEKISARANLVLDPLTDKFDDIHLRHDNLDLPLRTRKPTVFAVWNDLFHEDVGDDFIGEAYNHMFACHRHTFLILTKRTERLARFWDIYGESFAEHVWHGTTVCNQQEADEKIPHLLKVPGKRFLSIEPMLGPIDLSRYVGGRAYRCECGWHQTEHDIAFFGSKQTMCLDCRTYMNLGFNEHGYGFVNDPIHQVILGGESGSGARPMHPDWVRSVRDQCKSAGVQFMFKQWGEYLHYSQAKASYCGGIFMPDTCCDLDGGARVGKKKAGRTLDGIIHDALVW